MGGTAAGGIDWLVSIASRIIRRNPHQITVVAPLVAPNAEFILWGAEDTAKARIHASDESVDPAEIEAMILAQVILLQELAR